MASKFTLAHAKARREFRSIDLRIAGENPQALVRHAAAGAIFNVSGPTDYVESRFAAMVSEAALRHFDFWPAVRAADVDSLIVPAVDELKRIAAFVDEGGRLRVAHRNVSVGFTPASTAGHRMAVLERFSLERRPTRYRRNRWILRDPTGRHFFGERLFDLANEIVKLDGVEYATPEFVSEYRHEALPTTYAMGQWNYDQINLKQAWTITKGTPNVVIACIDDGVEISHPSLAGRIKLNPDPTEPKDKYGRDFFVNYNKLGHFDPRPKVFQSPYDQKSLNDIHGTPCAGILVANGSVNDVTGAAPGCLVLPVKVFHGGASMANDSRVADAIDYASDFADVISCSWTGVDSDDVESACLAAGFKRGGKGVPIFCATGNYGTGIGYPAAYSSTIAVGACTHLGNHASYSNQGAEIDLVAPSDGDNKGILTLDVYQGDMGYNDGVAILGGTGGELYSGFGGTSAATPLAAAVGALCLSVNPSLTRANLLTILRNTADKIGQENYISGHNPKFGYGRVNALKAVTQATPSPPNR